MSPEDVIVRVPEVNGVVVRGGSHELEVSVGYFTVVSCNEGATVIHLLLWDCLYHLAVLSVVDLKSLGVLLTDEQLLKFLKVEHILYFSVMLTILDVTRVVGLDSVNQVTIFSHHTHLNDMISELYPF